MPAAIRAMPAAVPNLLLRLLPRRRRRAALLRRERRRVGIEAAAAAAAAGRAGAGARGQRAGRAGEQQLAGAPVGLDLAEHTLYVSIHALRRCRVFRV
eukprot:364516-Chlamydomonas_euryale.AAC.1